ncbi:MAG: saccharopine dehydrogenase NADP-binding domain-containing protein [Candidatus Neomarinimicrobiota bacterium]
MAANKIFILGGYGSAGRLIAQYLLEYTEVELTVAGRNAERAAQAAGKLNRQCGSDRVTAVKVDARDQAGLTHALVGHDLLVVASSTAQFAREVAGAALAAGVDYLDIQYSTRRLEVLESLADEIASAGRVFITEGGFHPGVPAALVRYAAQKLPGLRRAVVGCALRVDWSSYQVGEDTAMEFAQELSDYRALVYRDGMWRKAPLWSTSVMLKMDFGDPFGRLYAAPMLLEEMRALPDLIPSLQETGFYITGFNWFADYLIMPLALGAIKLFPRLALRPMGRFLFWGLRRFSRPPYGVVLQMDARGDSSGLRVRVSHEDGYVLTAVPTVACLRQYLDGTIAKPGLYLMAQVVEPERFLADMADMGVGISRAEPFGGADEGIKS